MSSKTKATSKVELLPRIHINEFLSAYPEMCNMTKAGFQAFVGKKEWMRPSEWDEQLEKYKGKKIT